MIEPPATLPGILFYPRQPLPPDVDLLHSMTLGVRDDGTILIAHCSEDNPAVMATALRPILAALLEHPAILLNACGEKDAAAHLFDLWESDING